MTELPKGWTYSRLDEVATIIRGVTYSSKDVLPSSSSEAVMLLRATNIQKGVLDFLDPVWIPRSLVKSQQMLAEGDVVIASSSGSIQIVGKSASVKSSTDATFGAFCTTVRAKSIESGYLAHYLQDPTLRQKWSDLAGGSNINNLKTTDIAATPIPIPPLDEQKRIVEALEVHLSRLDKALAELDRVRNRFSSLRKAYLDAMYSGALTPSFGSPEIVRLSEVSAIINGDRGKNYPSKSFRVSAGIPFINAGHLDNGSIDMETMDFISTERFELLGSGKVAKGDVLFCLRGSLGKVGIVRDFEKGAIASSLAILRSNERILPEYLLGYFQTSTATEMIRRFDNGTAQPNLSSANLAKFEVPLFSLDIQEQIVSEVQIVNQNLEMLKETQTHLVLQVNQLRRSLLHGAFQGNLDRKKNHG